MRRHLGLSVEAVRRLVWWEHELLVQGLVEEFGDEETTHVGSGLGDLAGLGFTVR